MKKTFYMVAMFVFVVINISLNAYANQDFYTKEKYIAIIIDDFGNGSKDTQAMIDLNVPYTAAIMPNREFSVSHMEILHNAGKGIIVHMPMEPEIGKTSWLGEGAITSNLTKEAVRENVTLAIKQLHYSHGLNNHMGSKITKNAEILEEVASVLKENNLIMIDSLTTENSKMEEVCKNMQVKFLQRDVFLDSENNTSVDFVEKRMLKAAEIANKKGYAIAIGHVGKAGGLSTVNGIANMAPILEKQGIKFLTIQELYDILNNEDDVDQTAT